jgi:hypothetical protein
MSIDHPVRAFKTNRMRRANRTATILAASFLLFNAAAIHARAQTTVTVPGNASGHFGNPADLVVPFVPAISVSGPSSITVKYVGGTVTDCCGVDAGPNGVPWPATNSQTPLLEAWAFSGGEVPDLDALIGVFVSQRRMNRPGFQAIDGTKNLAKVGIAPDLLFFIGQGKTIQTDEAGTLFLGINDWAVRDNGGEFVVQVSATPSYDAATQFSSTQNPNGVWSYGCTQSLGATLHLYTRQTPIDGLYDWGTAPSCPQPNPRLGYNPTNASITPETATAPAHTIYFHPGPQDQNSVLRWTAPASGNYHVKAVFWGDDFVGPTTTDVHVLLNGLAIYSGEVSGFGPSSDQSFTSTISVAAGDTVDLAVGYGTDGSYGFDTTGVSAVITAE